MLPDAENELIVWYTAPYLFIANLNPNELILSTMIPLPTLNTEAQFVNLALEFSTYDMKPKMDFQLSKDDSMFLLKRIKAGEGRVYKIF